MENLKISSAQFEHRSGDKDYNLMVMEELAWNAAMEGSKVIALRMFGHRLYFCPSSQKMPNA